MSAVVVVKSLTLTHYQCTDLGQSLVADLCYRLIRESLFFARFLATGMGCRLICGMPYARVYTVIMLHCITIMCIPSRLD